MNRNYLDFHQGASLYIHLGRSWSWPKHGNMHNFPEFSTFFNDFLYFLVLFVLIVLFMSACSTSPPSGNQVDGLPLVAHTGAGP